MINPPEVKHNFELVQFFLVSIRLRLSYSALSTTKQNWRSCKMYSKRREFTRSWLSGDILRPTDFHIAALGFPRLFREYLPASSLHQNAFLTNPFLHLKGLYFRQICQAPLLRFLFVLFSILQCRILFRKSKLSMNVLENDDATLPLCRRSGSFPLKKAFWLIICLFHNVFACKIQTILLIVSVVKSMSDHFTIL